MTKSITSYRDLIVWQKAMALAELAYRVTSEFPETERFGLSAQLRRSAVSVPSNLAEGHRQRRPGYVHHVVIALGSHAELETQAQLAGRLGFLNERDLEQFMMLATEVGELAHGLLRALEAPA